MITCESYARRVSVTAIPLAAKSSSVDEPLLTRIASGDSSAVRACLVRYGGLVWSLARRFCSESEGEDAVQEIFIELWKNASRFDPQRGSEVTFIATIARRRLIDRRRRQARRPAPDPLPVEFVGEESSPDWRLETSEEAGVAQEAFNQLRPEQQEVLKLSIYDGWSHQQIADRLEMPLGTVKTHVRRGLARVRELLDRSPQAAKGGTA
ncbi:MAG: sigma-70 family RNA polymerase sigma factor [Pirellulales bacterium]|nr:sigma-70 family RNA polymerase sigma factor [Pirellulales bacterium]